MFLIRTIFEFLIIITFPIKAFSIYLAPIFFVHTTLILPHLPDSHGINFVEKISPPRICWCWITLIRHHTSHLPVSLSTSLSIYPLSIFLSINLSVSIFLSIHLSIFLSFYFSIYISIYLSVCIFISLPIHLWIKGLSSALGYCVSS